MASPYTGLDPSEWKAKTEELLESHPLTLKLIREIALETWTILWQTKIGEGRTAIRLDEIDVPATVVGYFFEKLFARELERRFPKQWRGTKSKDEKDLVCLINPTFSTEMKSSGQLGIKIFGNRSYNQKAVDETQIVKIEKSGYYITVNFYGQTINLLRFGWIDHDDWVSQASSTGQAATLKEAVYRDKLIEIPGFYRLSASVRLLPNVGPKTMPIFTSEGVTTLSDLQVYSGRNKTLLKFQEQLNKMKGFQDQAADQD